jgi:hypothetical protein
VNALTTVAARMANVKSASLPFALRPPPREAGELFLFALTALIGAKCTAELMRQAEKPF